MKRIYFLQFFVCFFVWNNSSSQTAQSRPNKSLEELAEKIAIDIENYRYEQAIEDSRNLLNQAKDTEEFYYVSKAYNALGHVYIDQKDSARARKNYTLGLEYAQLSQNDTLLSNSYNNLGNIYSEIPSTTEKGIDFYNKVIQIAQKQGDSFGLVIPKMNIGWTYLDRDQHKKAYPYIHEGLQIMDQLSRENEQERSSYFYSQIYMLHGRYFGKEKQYETAIDYFEKAVKLATNDSLILPAVEIYAAYAAMLEEKGDYRAAFKAQQKYIDYNSQVYEREKLREMEIANARFNISDYQRNLEIAEREQKYQNEIIQKSKEKVIIMVFSSLVMIFILVFLYKINRDRRGLIDKLKKKNVQYKEAKIEAEKLSSLKTRFFSTVSHEIRTPLYGVVGLTSLLLEDASLKKHQGDLRSLKFSADYLLALINDVLQMNKMESNEVKLENVSFSLRDLINSIVNSFEFTRIQNKNEIHIDIDENIPAYLIGDSIRLSQVLMNLVGNAMKFTERGNIHLTIKQTKESRNKSKIYFEIKDDGPGIPESKKKVIFEEFSQLSNSNYNYQGTGLGLPIVKRLLRLFNSKIKLESKEGEGSAFSFSISFSIDNSKETSNTIEEEIEAPLLSERKTILIVDDNRINQVVTKRILEKKEFDCDVAEDGQTAIQKVADEKYDLILMDLNMPGLSGLEASREIRKFNKKIPILALTAAEVEEIREEIQDAGMNGIIIKPYDVQQFYQIIYKNLSYSKIAEEV